MFDPGTLLSLILPRTVGAVTQLSNSRYFSTGHPCSAKQKAIAQIDKSLSE
ncbi:hypothetical protein [Nostoc sp. DedQUE09]|uniref:hypothetical protein n=1 Tax=Nostoc sp. DedQUE09 TaxID=3075394 RepID=UPI002AD583BB|nr:hypothetical protein [Nostoc sp. DedQUE09]MDZ7949717.1 hypothetical protein [Nostoc sp. DedQUE09]